MKTLREELVERTTLARHATLRIQEKAASDDIEIDEETAMSIYVSVNGLFENAVQGARGASDHGSTDASVKVGEAFTGTANGKRRRGLITLQTFFLSERLREVGLDVECVVIPEDRRFKQLPLPERVFVRFSWV